jgi:hypothetical protein
MAPRLHITCYRDVAWDSNSRPVGAPMTPPLAEAFVDITHESVASDQFPQYTHFICIRSEADCAIAFGENPVADQDYHHIEPGERLFYGVQSGHRIAVIGLVPELIPEMDEEVHVSDDE